MSVKAKLKQVYCKAISRASLKHQYESYFKKYKSHTFAGSTCSSYQQYEAHITKLYHAVEKGLSYQNYRAGFGKDNINQLIELMVSYSEKYDVNAYFYETSLSTLYAYLAKNKEYGLFDEALEKRIRSLPGKANADGGALSFLPVSAERVKCLGYEDFVKSRHSVRSFSAESVNIERVKAAVALAQHTPSACNRQGWRSIIVKNSDVIREILNNQNGNRGFGEGIDKLIVVTGDLRYFNKSRELHQVFIDGGMYAMNILHALHYEHIGSVPLSAALTDTQEENVRKLIDIDDAEVLIMFIGIGNYTGGEISTTISSRRPANITVI